MCDLNSVPNTGRVKMWRSICLGAERDARSPATHVVHVTQPMCTIAVCCACITMVCKTTNLWSCAVVLHSGGAGDAEDEEGGEGVAASERGSNKAAAGGAGDDEDVPDEAAEDEEVRTHIISPFFLVLCLR